MANLAKFPIKEKSNKPKENRLTTYDRRMNDIKKLDGKYNGWWIYQYATGDWNAKYYEYRKNARRAKNGNL